MGNVPSGGSRGSSDSSGSGFGGGSSMNRAPPEQENLMQFRSDESVEGEFVVVDSSNDSVTLAGSDDVESLLPEYEQTDSEVIVNLVQQEDVDTFEVEGVDEGSVGDTVTDVGGDDLARVVSEIDYNAIVEEQTGDSNRSEKKAVVEALSDIETETLSHSDVTRLEALIQDVDAYDSVTDVVRDVRRDWQEFHHSTSHREEMIDTSASQRAGKFFAKRYSKLDEDLSDTDRIVLTDTGDVDGETCMMIYEEVYDDNALVIPGGNGTDDSFEEILKKAPEGTTVTLADIAPEDNREWLQSLQEYGDGISIEIRDHHQWDRETKKRVIAHNLQEGHDSDEIVNEMVSIEQNRNSAAGLVFEKDASDADITSDIGGVSDDELRENLKECVEVADVADSMNRDHEKWEQAKHLRAFVSDMAPQDYTKLGAEYGTELISETEQGRAYAEGQLISEIKQSIAIAETARTTTVSTSDGNITAGIVHAGNADGSVIADKMRSDGVDFIALTSPSINQDGDKFTTNLSLRGSDAAPIADTVTTLLNGTGGGRAKTAGMRGIDVTEEYSAENLSEAREKHAKQNGEGAVRAVGRELPTAVAQAIKSEQD